MTRRSYDVPILLALCGLTFFWRLGAIGLFDLDEGLYVAAAREMFLSGDYVTPRINGLVFYDKPPLVYWLAAACFRLFGQSVFAARLPSAVACTLLVLLVYGFGRRYFGRRAGFMAGAMLTLSPLVGMVGRQMMLDATLCLWVGAALVGWFWAETEAGARARWGYLLFWAGSALGLLAKGLPGVLLPAATIGCFLLWEERLRPLGLVQRLGRLQWASGVPLFLLIAVPWHYLVWKSSPVGAGGRNPFLQEYVIHHHLQRLAGQDFQHNLPLLFFVPVLLGGFFPWSCFLPAALWDRGRQEGTPAGRARRFALCWAAVTFAIFSLSVSKCEVYILPMFAGAALLCGDWCARAAEDPRRGRGLRAATWSMAGVAAAILAGSLGLPALARQEGIPAGLLLDAAWSATALLGGTSLALALQWKEQGGRSLSALVLSAALVAGIVIGGGLRTLDAAFMAPLQELAREAGMRALRDGSALAIDTGSPRRPSVLFSLPEPWLRRDGPPLLENGSERGGPPLGVEAFLRKHGRAYLLTNASRARRLAGLPGLSPVERRGEWLLLRYEDRQAPGVLAADGRGRRDESPRSGPGGTAREGKG
jgi:4-amino-4-deoxy-L-arabinose transferase-like glycosyltransferase